MISDNKKSTMDEYQETQTIGLAEKVEIISTDDEKIKSIGELLSSDSSRNILKLLFDYVLTANQIAQKTGISLPLVIYHLKKMQDMGIVKITNVGKKIKTQDTKFYTSSKFAIVILPSGLTEKAKTSKSLANSFKTIYRFGSIAVAAVAAWFVSRIAQNIQTNNAAKVPSGAGAPATTGTIQSATNLTMTNTAPTTSAGSTQVLPVPAAPFGAEHGATPVLAPVIQAQQSAGFAVDVLWSVIITLSVVIAGLIIERVFRAYRH
jgi:DNA-binding transcriptional ArsR family regulator